MLPQRQVQHADAPCPWLRILYDGRALASTGFGIFIIVIEIGAVPKGVLLGFEGLGF